MRRRLFNRYLAVASLVLLAVVGGFKIHSLYYSRSVSDWNYLNLLKIRKTQGPFTFAVFGDNKNSVTTFNSLIEKINASDAAFALDDGDLVFDGSKEKYHFILEQLSRFKKPLLTAIGNHEIRENGRGNYYNFFGRFYYSFTVGKNYFIVLDDADEKGLDPWQMEWLKEELEKSQSYTNRFVFLHVPLYDPSKGELKQGHSLINLKSARQINALFDRYHVTMVFASHLHAYYRGNWRGTPYIVTGGAGAELAGTDPAHYFYHYIKVTVDGDRVSYDVIRVPSPGATLADRWLHDAWIYIYAFMVIHYLDLLLAGLALFLAANLFMVMRESRP